MLLNKHKTYLYTGLTILGLVLTLGLLIVGSHMSFWNYGSISADQFANYNIIKAGVSDNAASNGLPSQTVNFEFGSKTGGDVSVDNNGFDAISFAIQNANQKNPTIFNVHGSGKLTNGNAEFLFESLSPTDYTTEVFRQAYMPFSQLANSSGYDSTKFLSTISSTGERHVSIQTTATLDRIPVLNAIDLWQQMLKAVTPVVANTSYDLSLKFKDNVTLHATFSTDAELKTITGYDTGNLLDPVMNLAGYDKVKTIDVNLQGQRSSDNTVAVTVAKPASVPDYINGIVAFAGDPNNKFPRMYTTTITVEGDPAPAYVFYPAQ